MHFRYISCLKIRKYNVKTLCHSCIVARPSSTWEDGQSPRVELNESYYCNPVNKSEIKLNIERRKGVGDIDKVHELYNGPRNEDTKIRLIKELLKLPNHTHPDVIAYNETPKVVKLIGDKICHDFNPQQFHSLAKSLKLLKNDSSNFTGHRSYFFVGQLAQLESALIKYSMQKLVRMGFQVVSVPDVLNRSVIESCGMETRGKRSQVYSLDETTYGPDNCLSGTAEMSLAAYLMSKKLVPSALPLRLAAVSRCFRAETSRTSDERGIYRVHQFTKVEMFGVTEPQGSAEMLEEFRQFQEEHFASLGLHLQVLDMPAHELGAQAHRKYDLEAWLPGKNMWGEVSSSSDCTDYQSRRLGLRLDDGRFVHTVNGTACAVPRLLIALFETHQQADGSVVIPPPLQPFMNNATVISKANTKHLPLLKPIKRQSKKS